MVTNSPAIADAIRPLYEKLEHPGFLETIRALLEVALTALFIHPALYWIPSSFPILRLGQTVFYREFPVKKLSGMKLGLLVRWQERLLRTNETRRETANYFLMRSGRPRERSTSIAYLRLPILLKSREARDQLLTAAEKRGWGFSTMYPLPISEIPEIQSMFTGKTFSSAKDISERLVTIPTHLWLSEKDRAEIGNHLATLESVWMSEQVRQDVAVDLERSQTEVG